MKKSLLALAIAMAAASGAHASWDTGVDTGGAPNVGNGEAVLVLWDTNTKSSYVQDTGVLFNNLKNGSAFGSSVTLDGAALNTAFGGNYSNVQWTLAAASGKYANDALGTDIDTSGYGWINTGKAASLPLPPDMLNYVSNLVPKVNPFKAIEGGALQAGAASANGVVTAVNGSVQYAATAFTDDLLGYLPGVLQGSATNGQTTNLWYLGFGDANGEVPLQKILGTVSLNLSGANGTLSLTPAVPVPAAIWLLGSALAGLGGIARKRKQA